ncbi:hypothetical protein X975_11367, partial [Stegodyphus mimosarum]
MRCYSILKIFYKNFKHIKELSMKFEKLSQILVMNYTKQELGKRSFL